MNEKSENFANYILGKIAFTESELAQIIDLAVIRKIKKRQFLLHEGEICKYKCFVSKGLMRTYQIRDDGTEHIMLFSPEDWWSTDMDSYNNIRPSKFNIDALEDSEVLLWTKDNFDKLVADIPSLRSFTNNLLSKSFEVSQERVLSNISYSTEERYNNFIKTYPDIFNRVSLQMVASYLGISRETLSRIRNPKN